MPQNIVITGASSGLGAALAVCYAATDVVLALLGRDASRLTHIADLCRAKGATVTTATIDVTDQHAMQTFLQTFDDTHPVDLIIANAGVSAGTGADGVETLAQIKTIMAVNVNGVLHSIHPLIPRMQQRRGGQIAIISSLAAFRGAPNAPAYATSKATVKTYGQALAALLHKDNIAVSVVCPGFIKTPMTDINPFPMPLIMTADDAAKRIQHALRLRKRLIIFPWIMGVLVRLQNYLPDCVVDAIYARVPNKPTG